MKKKKNTTQKRENENPEWTREDFKKARPAGEVLAQFFGEERTANFLEENRKQLGRPKKQEKAKPISIRLDPVVEKTFRATGAGWQSRINQVLKEWAHNHPQHP